MWLWGKRKEKEQTEENVQVENTDQAIGTDQAPEEDAAEVKNEAEPDTVINTGSEPATEGNTVSSPSAEDDTVPETAIPDDTGSLPAEDKSEKESVWNRLKKGLTKTRKNIVYGIDTIFGAYDDLTEDFFDDLEEQLIMADLGVHTAEEVLDELRDMVKDERIRSTDDCRAALSRLIASRMSVDEHAYDFESGPAVVLVTGVNGVGKTTFCGKLAAKLHDEGKKVILAAADTFRAAATEQLIMWGERADCEVISGQEGSDPASVIFDALHAAKARHADLLICDTAGRLNNKKNLMNELNKIDRVITRELPEYRRENLIVLDATTGQNALSQAKDFSEVSDLTGIVLTKMDGTSKGGIAVAIASELNVPVKYIGVGETKEDLLRFNPADFSSAIFDGGDDGDD